MTFPYQIDGVGVVHISGSGTDRGVFGGVNTTIKTVHFSRGLTRIGNYAFSGCRALSSVEMPENLNSIGREAFSNCVGLKSIKIPNSVIGFDSYIFKGCTDLTTATLSETKNSLPPGLFSNCSALATITLPSVLTRIRENAFEGCTGLTAITIPTTLTEIYRDVFKGATNLSVTIKQPNPSQFAVGSTAFDDVKRIKVPKSGLPTYRNTSPWSSWRNKMDPIPSKRLAFKALNTYKALLTEEDILAQITELSGSAIGAGYGLKRITNIQALSGGSDIAEVSGIAIKIKKQAGIFTADFVLSHPLYLDIALTGARFEKEKAFIFDRANKAITGVTPKYRPLFKEMTSVTFPDEIDGINVEEIKAPQGLGDSVFGFTQHFISMPKIETIHLPKNLKTIGGGAFTKLGKLTSVKLPSSVKTIGNSAFFSCTNFTSINLEGVTTIGLAAFLGANSLQNIKLSEQLKIIQSGTFHSLNAHKSITIPNSVTEIKTDAFNTNLRLESVHLSKNLTALGNAVFEHCEKPNFYKPPQYLKKHWRYLF